MRHADEARLLFADLGDYRDAAAQAAQCDYRDRVNAFGPRVRLAAAQFEAV
jgi:hypothetical protein